MADEPPYADEIRIPFTMRVKIPPPRRSGMPGRGRATRPPPVHRPTELEPFDHDLGRIAADYIRQGKAIDAAIQQHAEWSRRQAALSAVVTAEAIPAGIALAELATVVVDGVAAVVAVVALPEILAGLAVVGIVAIILAGRRYNFNNAASARRWADALVDKARQGEHLPIADPLPPLPPMVAGPGLPPHTGQDQPTVRLPALGSPTAPVALPPVLADPQALSPDPAVVEHDGEPRSLSGRSREAARRRDPSVATALSDADWWAHHLINRAALRAGFWVLRAAGRAGWQADAPHNVAALPNTPDAQQRLRDAGVMRPLHNSGHGDWNRDVDAALKRIESELQSKFGSADSAQRDAAALAALNKLQRELRKNMLGAERITLLESSVGDQG